MRARSPASAHRLCLRAVTSALAVAAVGCTDAGPRRQQRDRVAPVEVAEITRGPIAQVGTFSGSLSARAEFTVSPRVAGRVRKLHVDLGDVVRRDQVVVELEDAEYQQALAQAVAELAVARASLALAKSALETAGRELERVRTLRARQVISESELDAAAAEHRARLAEVEVAEAQVARGNANRQAAQIRLGYTRVTASWTDSDTERVVAERFIAVGDTVAPNTPLLRVVDLDPITAVIFVAERDYRFLQPGQPATFTADAYPGERFTGKVERIAPAFHQGSRQARVELTVQNPEGRLKPGMFVQAAAVLREVEEADIVPAAAVTRRGDHTGVFVIDEEGQRALWREVEVGVRDGERVQVIGEGLQGRVVTLGQQMLDDGTRITIPDPDPPTVSEAAVK